MESDTDILKRILENIALVRKYIIEKNISQFKEERYWGERMIQEAADKHNIKIPSLQEIGCDVR